VTLPFILSSWGFSNFENRLKAYLLFIFHTIWGPDSMATYNKHKDRFWHDRSTRLLKDRGLVFSFSPKFFFLSFRLKVFIEF
jgi:hypothetical protein